GARRRPRAGGRGAIRASRTRAVRFNPPVALSCLPAGPTPYGSPKIGQVEKGRATMTEKTKDPAAVSRGRKGGSVRSAAQTAGTTAMNSRTMTCPTCGKIGHVGAMARWHGRNGERCRARGDQRKKGPLSHERRVEIGRMGGRKWAASLRERREAAGLRPRAPKERRPKLRVGPRLPPMLKRPRGRPGKTYVVTNPEGQSFPMINLERFCRQRGLSHRL